MSQSIHRKILFDFFDGKATALQRKYLEAWLREPGNEALFFQCLDEWESQHPQYIPDATPALEKFLASLETPGDDLAGSLQKPEPPPHPSPKWRRWGLAASVLLLVVGGWFFQKPLRYKTYRTNYAQTETFYLEDSSRVSLNANSTLWVPRWTFDEEREVILEGEGEFKVAHAADHKRFVVRTDRDFNVEVLGTEFIVFARPRGTKVVLNEGKVEVHHQQKQHTLRPGDVLSLPADSNLPELTQVAKPELLATWKDHQFYFDDVPLSEIRLTLEEHFGLRVIIADNSLNARRLSGYFKADSSQEIADILSALLDVPVQLNDNQLIIAAFKPTK